MSMDNPSIDCGNVVTASYYLLQLSGPLLYVSPMICVRNTHTTNYKPFPITDSPHILRSNTYTRCIGYN